MANRVLLGQMSGSQFGLYVSRPGFNVLSASDANLLFSSDWSLVSLHMRGSVSVGSGASRTVNFGKSFGTHPLCFISISDDARQSISSFAVWRFLGTYDVYPARRAIIHSNRIVFSNGPSSGSATYRYAVWDFDL